MFDIEYKGANAIVVSTKTTRIVIDPKVSLVGVKDVDVKNSIELGTEGRFLTGSESAKLSIEGPGEYEIGDFSVRGIALQRHIDTSEDGKKSTAYRIGVGEVSIAVLGNCDANLNEEVLEDIGMVDILILPVGGGGYTLDATSAVGIIRQVEPKVVIPVHYADDALSYEVPQEPVSVFTGELGAPIEEVDGRYKIKAASSVPRELTTVVLKRS